MKKLLVIVIFLAGVMISGDLLAQKTWDGGGDDPFWNNPNNWSDDKVPTINDDVEIILYSGFIAISEDAFCKNLSLQLNGGWSPVGFYIGKANNNFHKIYLFFLKIQLLLY